MKLSAIFIRYIDLLKPIARRILPEPLLVKSQIAYRKLQDARIAREPDRKFMRLSIVTSLIAEDIQSVLIIGTRSYSRENISQFENAGVITWTSDIDPDAQKYGAKDRHLTIDACRMTPAAFPIKFDAVVMNGVLGYGVNTTQQCADALASIRGLLDAGSRCVLGWNTDRCSNVREIAERSGFSLSRLANLGLGKKFTDSTHTYAFLRAI